MLREACCIFSLAAKEPKVAGRQRSSEIRGKQRWFPINDAQSSSKRTANRTFGLVSQPECPSTVAPTTKSELKATKK